jgi:hypothetical protein
VIRDLLQETIKKGRIEWQRHALEKMMERGISREAVKDVLLNGEIITNYPDDKPYPSALFLGWVNNQPFHVVVSLDSTTGWCFIITAYKPDTEHFESDYKTRRII